MKALKDLKISNTANDYLKQRCYKLPSGNLDSDMPEEPVKVLKEEQVGFKDILSPSSPNSFTFSSISSYYYFIDKQYHRLKSWMTEASEPCRSELSQVLFPLFVHLYLELLTGAGKQAAKSFFNRHYHVFRVNRDYEQTLTQILCAAGETNSSSVIQNLKSGKYLVRLSELTLNYFLRYLQTDNNSTLLQIFNNFLEVELSEVAVSQSSATFRCGGGGGDATSTSTASASTPLDCAAEDLSRLRSVLNAVRTAQPTMPSVAAYAAYNAANGLAFAKVDAAAQFLACGFEDSAIKLWRLTPPSPSNAYSAARPQPSPPPAETVLFCDTNPGDGGDSEGSDRSASAGRYGGAVAVLRGHRGPAFDAAFVPPSASQPMRIFSVGEDATMRLWDVQSGRAVALYRGHHLPVWRVAVASQPVYVATTSYDTTARLWTPECTFPVRAFMGHTASVGSVAFHPNCSYVASGSADRSVRLWQTTDATVARVFVRHKAPVNTIAFSPDGKLLASGSETGEVLVWDLAAGKVLCQVCPEVTQGSASPAVQEAGEPIVAVDWSKDSRVLFSASADGYVKGHFINTVECTDGVFSSTNSEIGNIFCGNASNASSLVHMSLTARNFLATVVAVHAEK